jgi:hypothetical protein
MGPTAKPTRQNRTITFDFHDEFAHFQLLSDGKAFLEFILAFILSIGFQLTHKATCTGGRCLTRHSHYARVRLGGLTIWRIQCTSCTAVFTVLPHFVLRYRHMSPEVARQALIATHGSLSLEWCATICNVSPMALYCLICARGHHSLVPLLVKCHLPLPTYILADEQHSRCLTDKVYLPTIVRCRVIWHLGYSASKSAAAFTQSYGAFQRVALAHEPSSQVQGALTDSFDSTVSSMRTLFPGARLGLCLRHALNKLPDKLVGASASGRQGLRSKFHTLRHRCRQRKSLQVVALGQRLHHFAKHIDTTGGEATVSAFVTGSRPKKQRISAGPCMRVHVGAKWQAGACRRQTGCSTCKSSPQAAFDEWRWAPPRNSMECEQFSARCSSGTVCCSRGSPWSR